MSDPHHLASLIKSHRYSYRHEADLQDKISMVLALAEIEHQREVRLSPADRPDFMVDRTVIEVKVASSRSTVIRQLLRYAYSDAVDAIVLVTTKASHLGMPSEINGKPVVLASLLDGAF